MGGDIKMLAIIFIEDLYVCPYMHRYTNFCTQNEVEYAVLFWNRKGEDLKLPSNYHYYNEPVKEDAGLLTKTIKFYKYRKWILFNIKKNKYDKIILLSTMSGIIIFDKLKKYKGKYIFDIRDYSYESVQPFYLMEKKIIKNSYCTIISSKGFENFLPKYNYFIMHNMQLSEQSIVKKFNKKKVGDTLNIVWNGTIRYFSHQRTILNRLANDSRFMMIFHGTGPEISLYVEYARKNGIKNITFTGAYNNSQKQALLQNADILNNSYWTEKVNEVLYALSNRFYDGIIYHVPQLVECKTYKADICMKNRIGIALDPAEENFSNRLYDWYFSIDPINFDNTCDELLRNAIEEEKETNHKVEDFF